MIGKRLLNARIKLINQYSSSNSVLLDVGSGSGYLLKNIQIKHKYGFDVNPESIKWLVEKKLWLDIDKKLPHLDIVCFFDVLEHIKTPQKLIKKLLIQTTIIISIPIFDNMHNIKTSKHYRPDEHYHYFTRKGLISFMKQCGCKLITENNDETLCGREKIMTFVFLKTHNPKTKIHIPKTQYQYLLIKEI